jgi:kumamolisin
MAGAKLAAADLTGAEMPKPLSDKLEHLDNVKEISSNAQKLFVAALAACLYSWLTVGTTTDVNLVSNRATSSLPIIQTSVPIVGFFYVAPLLLLGAYLYFHFYLQKLWDELGLLPSVFPDGDPLNRKTDPWLLSDLVRIHSVKLRSSTPFLTNLQIWVSVFVAWWVVPLSLLVLWARYLVRHELTGTIFQSIAAAIAISSAMFLYRLARNTLRGAERRPFVWPSSLLELRWVGPVGTCVFVAALLFGIAAGAINGTRSGTLEDNYWANETGPRTWIPRSMSFFGLSPFADLRGAELSAKPSEAALRDPSGIKTVRGIQLSASDLRFADMRASFLPLSFLTEADLRGADLLGADLERAGLIGTDFRGASLANTNLKQASLVKAMLDGADLKYAHLEGALGLTADQVLEADNWCQAFYDDAQLQMLGLPPNNNDQVLTWKRFDETNSSQGTPTTVEAAREADLRRFSTAPGLEQLNTLPQQPTTRNNQHPARLENATYRVPDITKVYDFPGGLDGTGQTIAIVELGGGYHDSDLGKYFQDLNLKKPLISWVAVDGHTNSPNELSGADGQVEGDIEIVGAAAPGASIVVYFSGPDAKGYLDAIRAVVQDQVHHPSVLLIGWGSPESAKSWNAQDLSEINNVLRSAAERNITVVVASGDHGARDEATEKRLRVDFPASSPWVLSVGGTQLNREGDSGFSEEVWNEPEFGGASGGGVSEVFDRPQWQDHVRVPHSLAATPGRGVPDVAINASLHSGYMLLMDGRYSVLGGTSIAAPMWAGLVALLNQGVGRNIGFINPVLYEKLGPAGVFRSITKGHNGIGELSGYCAGPGWNAATGWGTPDGTKILQALRSLIH